MPSNWASWHRKNRGPIEPPNRPPQVPDELAERLGKKLTRAFNTALAAHPAFPDAFINDSPQVSIASFNQRIGQRQ